MLTCYNTHQFTHNLNHRVRLRLLESIFHFIGKKFEKTIGIEAGTGELLRIGKTWFPLSFFLEVGFPGIFLVK